MRKRLLIGLFFVGTSAVAQVSNPSIVLMTNAPSGSCGAGLPDEQVFSTGFLYSCGNVVDGVGTWMLIGGGGSGTVTRVTFTGDGTVLSNTPSTAVTNSGTLNATLANAVANSVLAGPASGGAAAPTYQTAPTIAVTNMTGNGGFNISGTAASLSGALSANQLLGSLTAVAPTGQTVPSCSTSASALQWTSGTGFACNTAVVATTAANLAGTFTAHQFYGNNTGSTAAPTASLIGAADVSPNTYAVATGLVNVLAVSVTPAPPALVNGLMVEFMPNLNNTSTNPTLNVNGLGPKTVIKYRNVALNSNDMDSAQVAVVIYNGTNWELINPVSVTGTQGAVLSSSPNLTGIPAAPTAAAGTATTQIATTAFVSALGLSIPTGTATFTVGTNVTSVACATSYTCTNTRGEVTIVGGTATTGTIATVNFSATLGAAPGLCVVNQNGGGSLFDLGHGVPSTTSFTITAGVTVATATLNVDYQCIL